MARHIDLCVEGVGAEIVDMIFAREALRRVDLPGKRVGIEERTDGQRVDVLNVAGGSLLVLGEKVAALAALV